MVSFYGNSNLATQEISKRLFVFGCDVSTSVKIKKIYIDALILYKKYCIHENMFMCVCYQIYCFNLI